jgi:predicted transcriptional regulator YheO
MEKIQPSIKVRKNSIIALKNNSLRNREVYSQSKDLLKWKMKSRKYGNSRWIAKEIVFSYIKRT